MTVGVTSEGTPNLSQPGGDKNASPLRGRNNNFINKPRKKKGNTKQLFSTRKDTEMCEPVTTSSMVFQIEPSILESSIPKEEVKHKIII